MRLIDRFSTAATRPRTTRLGGHLQSTVDPKAPNASPKSTLYARVNAPMIHHCSRARVKRVRRTTGVLFVVELAGLALMLTASSAHADTVVLAIADSVTTVLDNIRNWIMGISAGLATVFLSIGGVRYMMGGGDPGEIEKAKTAFKSAGWGYGLAALAPLVVEILKGIVGA
jgi:Type IV secretion system pilin